MRAVPVIVFQSTPPARGGDSKPTVEVEPKKISIHAPCEGGDTTYGISDTIANQFQSTPPHEGGDAEIARQLSGSAISIHAPHEGGDDMLNP